MVMPNKASGPDNISGHVLKKFASSLRYPLALLHNLSYQTGQVPQDSKDANVVPSGDSPLPIHDDVENYRRIFLTSLVMKMFVNCLHLIVYDSL